MTKKVKKYVLIVIVILPLGFFVGIFIGRMSSSNYLTIMAAVGFLLALSGLAYLFWKYGVKKNNPEKFKQLVIEEKDERNIKIREKAGYTTWAITTCCLSFATLYLVVTGSSLVRWLMICVLTIHIFGFLICGYIYSKKL